MYERNCKGCNKIFETWSSGKRHCSNACRQACYRFRESQKTPAALLADPPLRSGPGSNRNARPAETRGENAPLNQAVGASADLHRRPAKGGRS